MTWLQIERSREARLWIKQIIVPTLIFVGGAMSIPEVRSAVKAKSVEIKDKINSKIKK